MKRRRSSAPGRLRPDGRWSHPILLAAILAALVACGPSAATDQPQTTSQPSLGGAGETAPAPTDASTDPASEAPAPTADASATNAPASPPATPPSGPASAASCSGSDENRDFFASMAAAVAWTVYCPVLPGGWFVDDGQYRLAGGGWMEISYHGPGDARLTLRQGAICQDGGCLPSGSDAGTTAFGDRAGGLVAGDGGTWSVVADPGATPSWVLVVTGLDEAATRQIAADLVIVDG